VRDYIITNLKPLAIISLSRRFFPAKTSVLIALKEKAPPDWHVFLAIADNEADFNDLLDAYKTRVEKDFTFWKPLYALQENMSVEFHLPMADVLGEIDPHIPLIPLSHLLKSIRTGRTEYGARRQFAPSGIRWIGASTITPLGLDFSRVERFIQPSSPMDKRSAYTQVRDVLFVRVGVGCAGRVAVVLGVIGKRSLEDLKRGVLSQQVFFVDEYEIRRTATKQVFQGFKIIYKRHPILHKELENNVIIEVELKPKQRAVGSQPMIYLLIPMSNLLESDDLIGRTANRNEVVRWRPSPSVFFEVVRAFAIASPKHREDMLMILEKVLE